MSLLSKAAGANVPHVFRQVFANAAARTSDPTEYDASDVNKIAFQVDTKEQYRLASIGPTVWELITGTGASVSGLEPLWKGGTPGNPFVDGDTVTAEYDKRIMFECPSGDTITFDLPAIGGTIRSRVGFHELTKASKDIGTINFNPNGTDNVEGFGDGTTLALVAGQGAPWGELEPDGDGRWNLVNGLHVFAPSDVFT